VRFWSLAVLGVACAHPLWSQTPPAATSSPGPAAASDSASDPAFSSAPSPVSASDAAGSYVSTPATGQEFEVNQLIAGGQREEAEKIIISALRAMPRDPKWITLLAEVRIDQGQEREAVKLLQAANQLGGRTAVRATLIGLAECIWNRMDLAEPEFRAAIQMDAFNPTAHYFLGRLLYNQKRFDEAIQESKNAFSLSPGYIRAYENLGLCYQGKHDEAEAEHWFLEAIRRDASSPRKTEWPALDLATMLIHDNRVAEAMPYLEQALAINPRNSKALLQMGVLRQRAGDNKGALESFRAAIQVDPQMESAYYQAALVCRQLGETDQAKQYLDKFMQLHDRNKMPIIPPA
jgi:tetratricopeptide (TPR) repeat protein